MAPETDTTLAKGDAAPAQEGLDGAVGLALSGGGYRAAAFHLGTLHYLHRVGLLKQLRMLSTVSGGTFVGAKYAVSLADKVPFLDFFRDFYVFLQDTDLVKLVAERIGRNRGGVPSRRYDLITAAAQTYAETFLKDPQTGQSYLFAKILDANFGLEEISFNTTEFRHGKAFRFRRSGNPLAWVGNRYLAIPPAEAGSLRLADIVAASSCFPGGFEPLAFPDDFVWPGGKIPAAVREIFADADGQPRPVALMDGGVYDNQGIESLVAAEEDLKTKLGLLIVSDVALKHSEHHLLPAGPRVVSPTMAQARLLTLGLFWGCLLSVGLLSWQLLRRAWAGPGYAWDQLLCGVPLVVAGSTALWMWWLRRFIRFRVLPHLPDLGSMDLKDLRRLTLDEALYMITVRTTSLFAMTGSVLMERIRSLVYTFVDGETHYGSKRMSNLIHDLSETEPFAALPGIAPPSVLLRNVANAAATMPTTLWFTADHQLSSLVACGQATTCYNLMRFIVRRYGADVAQYPERVATLWAQLSTDWALLLQDSYVFLREDLPQQSFVYPESGKTRVDDVIQAATGVRQFAH